MVKNDGSYTVEHLWKLITSKHLSKQTKGFKLVELNLWP